MAVALPLRAFAQEGEPVCHVGAYRLADGNVVDIAARGSELGWAALDGRYGVVSRPADAASVAISFGSCAERSITFEGVRGRAVDLHVRDLTFTSGNVALQGRLVLPQGTGKVPIIVLGHGAENTSAIGYAWTQRVFPSAGVGVFVFDKRGTGKSGGAYTQNFSALADDVVAAVGVARRLAGARAGRVGLSGTSQAGWVLPMAAARTSVDFIIINSGVAGTVADEDRNETLRALKLAGRDAQALAKAAEIVDGTTVVLSSRGKSGLDAFDALVTKYESEPWLKDVAGAGTPTAALVGYAQRMNVAELNELASNYDWDNSPPWVFDSAAALRTQKAPVLWMIAADDTLGAGDETPRNLLALRNAGLPVTILRFPNTEHGLLEYRVLPDGKRLRTRYTFGSLQAELDFARDGTLKGTYGAAERVQ